MQDLHGITYLILCHLLPEEKNNNLKSGVQNHLKNGAYPKSLMSRKKITLKFLIMKNLILSAFMIFVLVLNAYSQTGDKTLILKKKRYYQNDQKLTYPQLKDILNNNPASAPEFKKYKAASGLAMPFLVVGSVGCLAGGAISLASSIKQTNDINNGKLSGTYANALPIILAAGAVTLVGIVLILPANKHLKNSINNYNSSVKTVGYEPVQFNLMVNSNGLGIRMRF